MNYAADQTLDHYRLEKISCACKDFPHQTFTPYLRVVQSHGFDPWILNMAATITYADMHIEELGNLRALAQECDYGIPDIAGGLHNTL